MTDVRRSLGARVALWGGGIVILVIALVGAAALLLDTQPGHRFVADRIAATEMQNGLKIRVGRIDGSLYSRTRLRDVQLIDLDGRFARISEAELDWHPFQFLLANRLDIDSLSVPRAQWDRYPRLRPADPDAPILPDFDIAIDDARVDRLTIGADIVGSQRVARANGRVIIESGRADVALDARLVDGDDRISLALVAEPDRDRFDINADIIAPRGGAITVLAGVDRGLTGVIRGQGSFRNWAGTLAMDSGGQPLARLALAAAAGRYRADGRIYPDTVSANTMVGALTAGGLAIAVDGRFAERRWDGSVGVVADRFTLDLAGGLDLAQNRFAAMRVDGWLRRTEGILPRFTGDNIRFALLLDGMIAEPRFDYRLTATAAQIDGIRLSGVDMRGSGVNRRGMAAIPVAARIARITGIGAQAEQIVADARVDGVVTWADGIIASDQLRISGRGINGQVALRADTGRGTLDGRLTGALPGLELAGLGRLDVGTTMTVSAGGGRAVQARGDIRAVMRRLDNAFLRTVGGGLPSLTSQIAFGGDGVLRFDNFRVTAPLLALTGSGVRRADGTLSIATRGMHRTYGPVNATIEGLISRPEVVLRLANPVPAAQLTDVLLRLTPNADGFAVVANGGSLLGPFSSNAAILLPRSGAPVIDVQSLVVSGTTARGRVAVVDGGLAGQLLVAGGGIDGSLVLSAPGGIQRILANMTARDARFAGPPPIMVGRGRLVATVLLDPRGTDIDATFETTGFRRGTLSIARLAGNARIINGVGTVRSSLAGARGRAFSVQSVANVSRNRIVINGTGALARRPIRLLRPISLTRISDGWRLDPTEMTYAGGRMQVSGSFGARATTIVAGLDNMPLSLIDLAYPDSGLGGRASGRLTYADMGNQPSGTAQLRLTGLTRAGLSETSAPIDAAINAAVSPTSAAIRGVVQRGGTTIGRIQARVSPLAANGALLDRIMAAPLFAQVRYGGEAGTLWRLSGIEAIDVSGDVSVAADVRGTLNDPAITGVLRATNARVEAFASGTVVTGASAVGRFSGSQLQLRSISGQTAGGGTVTGGGDFNLASVDGFAMDLRLQAERALLIDRDDLVARVTGPVRLVGQGSGGTISGQLRLDAGSFRLGQATAVESLPVIRVIEINTPADRPDLRREQSPWRLALDITGRNRFMVTGLGLESEWSTDIGVRGDLTNFAITGTADLVRGDYTFAGRRFELQQGRIRFTGSTPIDPALDILAVDDIAGIDASIRVRGSGLRPEISFSSVPALPEDELLSRILFGASITDISVTEAAQLGLALASLRSGDGGLDPINAIRRATGLDRLRILPANTEIGAATSVAAGKYLTRRTYVEIITDGQGYSATRAEFQITRWLALLGSISTLGQESVNVRVRRDY